MERLTSHEAYVKSCAMWNWLADETERRQEKVMKREYFLANGIEEKNIPACGCYCCEYVNKNWYGDCNKCPIIWPLEKRTVDFLKRNDAYIENGRNDVCLYSIFQCWSKTSYWREAACLARQIANLPEYIKEVE